MVRFSHCSSTGWRSSPDEKLYPNPANIDVVAVREGVMALGTGFSSAMLEGGRARSGATLAGVSVVSDAGFGATIIATASSVAALAEL